ncbi:MAG: hypothetical protein E7256_10765 [Lachnospiraceae bacterium]|nr:hypothetical protein [Lachnospiraceae bacterium]
MYQAAEEEREAGGWRTRGWNPKCPAHDEPKCTGILDYQTVIFCQIVKDSGAFLSAHASEHLDFIPSSASFSSSASVS